MKLFIVLPLIYDDLIQVQYRLLYLINSTGCIDFHNKKESPHPSFSLQTAKIKVKVRQLQ